MLLRFDITCYNFHYDTLKNTNISPYVRKKYRIEKNITKHVIYLIIRYIHTECDDDINCL